MNDWSNFASNAQVQVTYVVTLSATPDLLPHLIKQFQEDAHAGGGAVRTIASHDSNGLASVTIRYTGNWQPGRFQLEGLVYQFKVDHPAPSEVRAAAERDSQPFPY